VLPPSRARHHRISYDESFIESFVARVDAAPPAGWPADAWLRTDMTNPLPVIAALTPHAVTLDDPKTKGLVVTSHGSRIVYEAAQAVRVNYVVLRQAEFPAFLVPASLARRLIEETLAARKSVAALR
jgi:hypothetical protein